MAHKYKLLVIDDEAEILNTIKSYFEKRDFLVETALNGEEGLNKLRNQSFDVALIDLVMPQLSGLDGCPQNEQCLLLLLLKLATSTLYGHIKQCKCAHNNYRLKHA